MRTLVLALSLLLLAACGLAPTTATPVPQSDQATLLSDRVPNPRAFGDPKAPIVMREFSDFQ